MTLGAYLAVLRRHWALFVACCLLGVLLAAFVAIRQPARYESTAEALVSTQSASTSSDLAAAGTYASQAVVTLAKVATTDYVLAPAIAKLRLPTTPVALREHITVAADQNSTILLITAESSTPSSSAEIANAIGNSLSTAAPTLSPQSSNANSQVKVTVLQRATPPSGPSGTSLPYLLAFGLLGGLIVGAAAVSLREQLDARVRNAREATSRVHVPVLGSIRFDRLMKRYPMVMQGRPVGPLAEDFRALRNNLQAADPTQSLRSIVVTSSGESEGKTSIVANLALALAQNNLKVAVLDADLRRSGLSHLLGLEKAPGLADVLVGDVEIQEVVRELDVEGFTVVPAGSPTSNPNELLQTSLMTSIIRTFSDTFDVVLIDSPPILPVSDAGVLARQTDGALLVAALGEVKRQHLHDAEIALERSGADVLGVVLSMVPKQQSSASYGSYERRPNVPTPAARSLSRPIPTTDAGA